MRKTETIERISGSGCRYYKRLLAENGLPNIRWHDLRSTYCALLLKKAYNPKAVSKLMGHAKELITIAVYGDNKDIIAKCLPEIETYMKEVLPNMEEMESFKKELLEIVMDVTEFLPEAGWERTKVRFSIYTNLAICGKIKKFFECCFVRMELLRYAKFQKQQIVNGIRCGPVWPRFE